jgi:hypothetical protein
MLLESERSGKCSVNGADNHQLGVIRTLSPLSIGKPICLSPDFLGISAPRTGTHWLRNNLARHPRLRLLGENLWFYDLCLPYHHFDHYCLPDLINGDLTPMYCLLTSSEVARVRQLLPNGKLLCILRDPVSRAWSHLKHMERHREAVFARGETDFLRAAYCAYALVHGDYLGTLRRWRSAFAASELLIGFYEDIQRRPAEFLNDVLAHLGLEGDFVWADLNKRHNDDPTARICPAHLESFLRQIYWRRTEELVNEFRLDPPPEWDRTLRSESSFELDYWIYNQEDISGVKREVLRKWLA